MGKPKKPKTRKQLLEEIWFLRAMCGICLKCSRERDAGDLVRYEIWLEEDGSFMAMAHFGGGSGGVGNTPKAAMESSYQNMLRFLKSEGRRALAKEPWKALPGKLKEYDRKRKKRK